MTKSFKNFSNTFKFSLLTLSSTFIAADDQPILDPYAPITNAINNQTDSIEDLFSRESGKKYLADPENESLRDRTHFVEDLINFRQNLATEQLARDQDLFFMRAPSLSLFTDNIDIINENQMKFSTLTSASLDSDSALDSGLKQELKERTAHFFLKRGFLDADDVNADKDVNELSNLYPNRGPRTDKGIYTTSLYVGNPRSLVRYHFQNYCDNFSGSTSSSDTSNESICQAFLGDTSFGGYSPNSASADMSAESLFSPPENNAAQDYIQNITDPFPRNLFAYKKAGNEFIADGDYDVEEIARAIVDKSYRSLSQYVLNDIRNRHMKQNYSGSESNNSSDSSEQYSVMELVERMATERINNKDQWIENLESTSTEGLLREIAIIESTRLFIDYLKLQQTEHTEALLAASVAQNQNFMEKISNLLAAPNETNEFLDDTVFGQ